MRVWLPINSDCSGHDKYDKYMPRTLISLMSGPQHKVFDHAQILTIRKLNVLKFCRCDDYKRLQTHMLGHLSSALIIGFFFLRFKRMRIFQTFKMWRSVKYDKYNWVSSWPQFLWEHFQWLSSKNSLYTFDTFGWSSKGEKRSQQCFFSNHFTFSQQ